MFEGGSDSVEVLFVDPKTKYQQSLETGGRFAAYVSYQTRSFKTSAEPSGDRIDA